MMLRKECSVGSKRVLLSESFLLPPLFSVKSKSFFLSLSYAERKFARDGISIKLRHHVEKVEEVNLELYEIFETSVYAFSRVYCT